MKKTSLSLFGAALVAAVTVWNAQAEDLPAGAIDFGSLSSLAGKGEFVEVNIQSNLINLAAKLAEKQEPQVADLIKGLQGIRVNVLGLSDENREQVQRIFNGRRADWEKTGWESIVTAKKDGEDVRVYLKTKAESVQGLAVTVLSSKGEAVLVNIIGDIRPEKIALVAERFNIEPLKNIGPMVEKEHTHH